MYASNRYERELMRIPKNYAGNAFAPHRDNRQQEGGQTAGATTDDRASEREEMAQPRQVTKTEPTVLQNENQDQNQDQNQNQNQNSSDDRDRDERTAKRDSFPDVGKAAEVEAAPGGENVSVVSEEHRSGGFFSGHGNLGNEEWLLLGLMALTRKERQERDADGADSEKNDEIFWLLMILLLLG